MGYSKGCHTTFHHRYHIVWAPKYRYKVLIGEVRLRVREIAARLGISLGRVNYCLKALAGEGAVKLANFRASRTKLRYAYVLTPSGVAQRLALTRQFLERKLAEYERLEAQIKSLQRDLE